MVVVYRSWKNIACTRKCITLYYPIDMAVMIYQYIDEIIRLRHTNNSLLVKPYPSNPSKQHSRIE